MVLKWIFDRLVSFVGLLFLWPILLVVAVLIKVKMPGGPAFFVQKRVGRGGKFFPGNAGAGSCFMENWSWKLINS